MKLALKIMLVIFLVWMTIGIYLVNTDHEKAQIVMGLGVFYFSFCLSSLCPFVKLNAILEPLI